ncbi:hypothetical protein [Microbacterium sp. RG1]|uniref:hypothetical protein n=1 Tax=Microbacterium sp. RG1 TaxID=2489212 RepID=UPI0010CA40F7|nr:hypothetical protein [Microbacterium sp. RG1]QCQ17045.1 hypothetical protein EHF32_10110 [Microbacterium sp. RG1]
MRRFLGKLVSFGSSTVINLTVNILSIPALVHVVGPADWAGIVVAQSIAGIAGVIVGFGWNLTGPSMIAAAAPELRRGQLQNSVRIRGLLFLVIAPIAVAVAVLLTGLNPLAAALVTLGYLLQPLGAVWYFVGQSQPLRVLGLDTLPRAAGVVVGVVAAALTSSVIAYALVVLALGLCGLVASYAVALHGAPRPAPFTWAAAAAEMRSQRYAVVTAGTANLYGGTPPILAGWFVPDAVEPLALAYRLYTAIMNALLPFLQVFQGWIPAAGPTLQRRRLTIAVWAAGSIGAVVGTTAAAAIPFAGWVLSGGAIEVGADLAVPVGVAVGAVVVTQIVGLACLTLIGRARTVAQGAVLGATVGLSAMVVLSAMAGGGGLLWGLAFAELLVAAYQVIGFIRWLRATRS